MRIQPSGKYVKYVKNERKECVDVSAVVYAIRVSLVICFGFHLGNAFCPLKKPL